MASNNASSNKRIIYAVHCVIMVLFMFGFGALEPIGSITPMGMKVLGVFLGLMWGWIFVGLGWPSLLGFVALGFTGFFSVNSAFANGAANVSWLTCVMCFAFAGLMEGCNVTEYIAAKVLSAKVLIGRPWLTITAMFVTMYIIGAAASGMAAAFMLWAVLYKIAEMAGLQKGDKLIGYLICGSIMIAISGANLIPFKPATAVFLGFYQSALGTTINPAMFILFNLIMSVLLIAGLVVIGKYIVRVDATILGEGDKFAYLRGKKITFEQGVGLGAIAAFLVMLLLPCIVSTEIPFVGMLNNLGTLGVVAVIFAVVSIVLFVVQGKTFDVGGAFKKGQQWEVLLLLMVTFPLADAMKSADCGVLAAINKLIAPHLTGVPVAIYVVVCMLIAGIVTQVVHNVVVGAMFIPIMMPLCVGMGGNTEVLFVLMFWALQAAYITPAASAQSAVMHGNDWVAGKTAYFWGSVFFVWVVVLFATVGQLLGNMLF